MTLQTRILQALESHPGGLTIPELVRDVGGSDSGIRRELGRLAAQGSVFDRREPASQPGRPASRYLRAPQHADAWVEMISALLDRVERLETPLAPDGPAVTPARSESSGPLPDRLIGQLARSGYAPHDSSTGKDAASGVSRITLRICPVAAAVLEPRGQRVCVLHHRLLNAQCEASGADLIAFTVGHPYFGSCEVLARLAPDPVSP